MRLAHYGSEARPSRTTPAMVAPTVTSDFVTCDANEAVASVAYRLSELVAIYPITPSSSTKPSHAEVS